MEKLTVWHPCSPGSKVVVVRSWFQKLVYPKEFATLSEVLRYYCWTSR